MNRIYFTQYKMPDGRKEKIWIDRPAEITDIANSVIGHGGKFEAEVLQTGEVSLTCAYDDPEEGMIDIAIEVVPNGPGMKEAVDKLVRDAWDRIQIQKGDG